MSRNQDAREKLYNAEGINPSLNPKNLSNVLRDVGVNRAGQKDIKSLYHSINELDLGGKILVLDRGFFSEGTIKFLRGKKNSYVLPAGTEDALPETGRARNREGKIQYMNEAGGKDPYRLRYERQEAGNLSALQETGGDGEDV